MATAVWEVVGGACKGGVIVKTSKDLDSAKEPDRLSTGSLVRAVEYDCKLGRLHYELLMGAGPTSGWVTTEVGGQDLLTKNSSRELTKLAEKCEDPFRDYVYYSSEIKPDDLTARKLEEAIIKKHNKSCAPEEKLGAVCLQDASTEDECSSVAASTDTELQNAAKYSEEAMQSYSQRLGRAFEASTPESEPQLVPVPISKVEQEERPLAASKPDGILEKMSKSMQRCRSCTDRYDDAGSYSDEEENLCSHCRLPLGEFTYSQDGKLLHGECAAELIVENMREEDEERKNEDRKEKEQMRKDYDIGWQPLQHIPLNDSPASKLTMSDVSHGMMCLVMGDKLKSVHIASTTEPAASVNLEYLSIALQVRRRKGHEPIFSLDPVDPTDRNTMQKKVFIPEWLEGTCAGDILFQSDYHLKELSMGQYEQPVLGMKSVFDYSGVEGYGKWNAREWFMVRKAEVQVSQKNVLIPHVKMGVEAREQVFSGSHMEDAPITRKDHPMVRYAEEFTRNFDLIAERKSVVFHLRELAKASVLAKFFLDANIQLNESWFQLASSKESFCSMEVPQLWNKRITSAIHVQDGAIEKKDMVDAPLMHGVYGGVSFGLDKFSLAGKARSAAVTGQPPMPLAPTLSLPATFGAPRLMTQAARYMPSAGTRPMMGSLASPVMMSVSAAPARKAGAALGGVDLRLDNFDVTELRKVELESPAGLEACVPIGEAFWSALDSTDVFKDGEQKLLKQVFDPELSDRRSEGDLFVPPDARLPHIKQLRELVNEEEALRQRRKEHFCDKKFLMGSPGPLFPSSWTPSYQIETGATSVQVSEGRPHAHLHARSDFHAEDLVLQHVLKSSTAVFHKQTEDGVQFRIYRFGTMELRTIQQQKVEEEIVAVFSIHAPTDVSSRGHSTISQQAKVVKATQYVERANYGNATVLKSNPAHCYYVVLDVEGGHKILTELMDDGSATWAEDPEGIEDRNSIAKVIQSSACATATVGHLKNLQLNHTRVSSKDYALAAYRRAVRK
mmetsp:Transcript_58542/g.110398  ORF Transcript_58542/g.110398 Transcript_58542/m.110398 type:complete len:1012 (-) Transcript_58542:151-3186(-)